MAEYGTENLLHLSALQHFVFCRRQWYLIHQEQVWSDNYLTQAGHIHHERAHNNKLTEKRGEVLISRALPVSSYILGLYGICDVVEWHRTSNDLGIKIGKYDGYWLPMAVEYKRGRPKQGKEDIIQVVAQSLCLEEMLLVKLDSCFLYYGETRRRVEIEIDDSLRAYVAEVSSEMHQIVKRGTIIKPKKKANCKACSLIDLCLPELSKKNDVDRYLLDSIEDDL